LVSGLNLQDALQDALV